MAVLSVVVCAVVGIAVGCSTITTTSCCPAYCACCQPIVGCALGDADAVVVAVFVFVLCWMSETYPYYSESDNYGK